MKRRLIVFSLLYFILLATAAHFLYPVMMADAVNRYAPMADAFAGGDWYHAFHPRFGILFSVLAGSLSYCSSLAGDYACQIISILFLSLSSIPLWFVFKKLFDEETAWLGMLFIVLMPDFVVYALDALREPMRIFGFAMVAWSFVDKRFSWPLAIGLFVLGVSRGDCWAHSCWILVLWCILMIRRSQFKMIVLPVMSFLTASLIMSSFVYAYTGIFVPATQLIKVWNRFL